MLFEPSNRLATSQCQMDFFFAFLWLATRSSFDRMQMPCHAENTSSHSNTEVLEHRPRGVLEWEVLLGNYLCYCNELAAIRQC